MVVNGRPGVGYSSDEGQKQKPQAVAESTSRRLKNTTRQRERTAVATKIQ